MEKTVLVLVVLVTLAMVQTEAALDLTGWTPTCESDGSITLPINALFRGFLVNVSDPSTTPAKCQTTLSTKMLDTAVFSIAKNCINATNHSVKLIMEHETATSNRYGGKDYTEVTITCSITLDGKGIKQFASLDMTVNGPTPQKKIIGGLVAGIPLMLEVASGSDGATATAITGPLYLGQTDAFLRVKHSVSGGGDHYVLLPLSCRVTNGGVSYVFFKADDTTCYYDSNDMGPFTVNSPVTTGNDITFAPFYPSKFTTGDKITLTCEILVCPSAPTAATASYCGRVLTVLWACSKQSPLIQPIPATTRAPTPAPPPPSVLGRRRRAAGGQEMHTRVLEVTYSVLPGPVPRGPTAGGAGAAISVPLLAAVASLWML